MIYLDHNATTRLRPEALDAMAVARTNHRNPMSLHRPGRRARVSLDQARESVRQLCGAPKADVVFTSGGTEADHLAVRGLAHAQRKSRGADTVLLSDIEHPAVTEAAQILKAEGFKILSVPAPDGRVSTSALADLLNEKVAVVEVMLAHNTTGIVQPVEEIGELAIRSGIPMHVDAVQAAGKIPIDFYKLGATSLALSAHKFGGPRGVGALVLQKCVELSPIWTGGGQEEGKRSGSHAGALIAGMAAAADAIELQTVETAQKRDFLEQGILKLSKINVLGAEHPRLPNTLSVIIDGIVGRDFVEAMDAKGIALSAGAACHSAGGGSTVAGQVRFSIGNDTTTEQLNEAIAAATETVQALRGKV